MSKEDKATEDNKNANTEVTMSFKERVLKYFGATNSHIFPFLRIVKVKTGVEIYIEPEVYKASPKKMYRLMGTIRSVAQKKGHKTAFHKAMTGPGFLWVGSKGGAS